MIVAFLWLVDMVTFVACLLRLFGCWLVVVLCVCVCLECDSFVVVVVDCGF